MNNGYVKLHRNLFDSFIFQNEKLLKIFVWCLLKASHKQREVIVGRKTILLKEGEFVFGRHKAAEELNMSPSTIWDYMKLLEKSNVIDIQSNNKYSLINLRKWAIYQGSQNYSDSKYDNTYDNKSTSNKQQIDTNNKDNNLNNEKNEELYLRIVTKLNKTSNKNYRSNALKTMELIDARLNDGFKEEDFYKVIDNKCKDWLNDSRMNKYLRPETLFGNKFENYLNESTTTNTSEIISSNKILYNKPKIEYKEDSLEIMRKQHGLV